MRLRPASPLATAAEEAAEQAPEGAVFVRLFVDAKRTLRQKARRPQDVAKAVALSEQGRP